EKEEGHEEGGREEDDHQGRFDGEEDHQEGGLFEEEGVEGALEQEGIGQEELQEDRGSRQRRRLRQRRRRARVGATTAANPQRRADARQSSGAPQRRNGVATNELEPGERRRSAFFGARRPPEGCFGA